MKHRNIGLALLLVAALCSQTMLGLTAQQLDEKRKTIRALLDTPISANQAQNAANAEKLKMHRDTLKKAKKLTHELNEARINKKIQDFTYGRTREEAEEIGVAGAAGASQCESNFANYRGDTTAQIQTLESLLETAQEQLVKMTQRATDAETKIKANDSGCAKELDRSIKEVQRLTDQQRLTQGELNQCQAELAAANAKLETAKKKFSELNEMDRVKGRELEAKDLELAKVKAELATTKTDLENARNSLEGYRDVFTKEQAKVKELEARVKELEGASLPAAY